MAKVDASSLDGAWKDSAATGYTTLQRMKLGRPNASHCLIELFPLPSPSTKDWLYNQYSQLPFLADRTSYYERIAPFRTQYLQQQLQRYEPKAVIFYSANRNYRLWWQQIANVSFTNDDPAIGNNGKTLFIIMQHPTAHGIPNTYFEQVGQSIRTLIGSSP